MTKKELKKIAQQIAKLEQECNNLEADTSMLHEQIINLCSKVTSIEEMTLVDEMVQEILEK